MDDKRRAADLARDARVFAVGADEMELFNQRLAQGARAVLRDDDGPEFKVVRMLPDGRLVIVPARNARGDYRWQETVTVDANVLADLLRQAGVVR